MTTQSRVLDFNELDAIYLCIIIEIKDTIYLMGNKWEQAWYHWRDKQLNKAMKEWFESLPLTIRENGLEKPTL